MNEELSGIESDEKIEKSLGIIKEIFDKIFNRIDSLEHQFNHDQRSGMQKLNEVYLGLEDNMNRLVKDSLPLHIKTIVFRSLKDVVVPLFEQFLSDIFETVNETYQNGFNHFSMKLASEEKKINDFKEQMATVMAFFEKSSIAINRVILSTETLHQSILKKTEETQKDKNSKIEAKLEKIIENQKNMMEMMQKMVDRLSVVEENIENIQQKEEQKMTEPREGDSPKMQIPYDIYQEHEKKEGIINNSIQAKFMTQPPQNTPGQSYQFQPPRKTNESPRIPSFGYPQPQSYQDPRVGYSYQDPYYRPVPPLPQYASSPGYPPLYMQENEFYPPNSGSRGRHVTIPIDLLEELQKFKMIEKDKK